MDLGLGNIAIWGTIYRLPVLLILLVAGMICFGVLRIIWRRFIRRSPTTAYASMTNARLRIHLPLSLSLFICHLD